MAKKSKVDLAVIAGIAQDACAADSAATISNIDRATRLHAALGDVDRDSDRVKAAGEAYRATCAAYWVANVAELTGDDAARITRALALKPAKVRQESDDTRAKLKTCRAYGRNLWARDCRLAYPEWFAKEEAGEAEAGEADTAEADAQPVLSPEEVLAAFRATMSTLPTDEALALANRIIEDAKGFARMVKAGVKIPRTLEVAA